MATFVRVAWSYRVHLPAFRVLRFVSVGALARVENPGAKSRIANGVSRFAIRHSLLAISEQTTSRAQNMRRGDGIL
jgi:hypothetical protein